LEHAGKKPTLPKQCLPQLEAHVIFEGQVAVSPNPRRSSINSGGRNLEDVMFSSQPHVHNEDELIGADEAFRWTEDEVVTEMCRNRARRRRIGLSFLGAFGLAALVVSVKVGLGMH
jgi:hypothetical protein